MPYLTPHQQRDLALALGKERAITGTLDGYRFEAILCPILEDCVPAIQTDPSRVTDTRDKKWFDLKQPARGIEAKTYQVGVATIAPGVSVKNVLKRIPPDILPEHLSRTQGGRRELDRDADPAAVGEVLLAYIEATRHQHAIEKGIKGTHDFAVLFRNKKFTHVGYWEEPFNLEDASHFDWGWSKYGLEARQDGDTILVWYSNGRQLFYRFEAPPDVQTFDVPDLDIVVLTKQELDEMLAEAAAKGPIAHR